MTNLKIGVEMRKIRLSLAVIIAIRQLKDPKKTVHQYRPIRASIKEIGMEHTCFELRQKFCYRGGGVKWVKRIRCARSDCYRRRNG